MKDRIRILTEKYPWLIQFGKYLLIGGGTAVLELALFALLSNVIALAPANILAVTTATVGNFILNGRFAFRKVSNMWRSVILYGTLFGLNMLFSTLMIGFLVHSFGIAKNLAKLSTMACIVSWNFILYRKVIFI